MQKDIKLLAGSTAIYGLASILQKGLDYLLNDLGPLTVVGYVKIKNEGSNSIFKNLGFTQNISNEYPESYRYELRKEK